MGTRRRFAASRGFTLVELMVVMAVAVVLMAGAYQLFIAQQRTYSVQDDLSRVQQEARMAETLITKAIQLAGSSAAYVPGVSQTVSMRGQAVLAATDRYLVLQYDDPLNTADPNYVSAEEVVAFAVSKTAPTVGGGTDTITAVTYFDKNGDGTITEADRHTLSIGLDLTGPPYTLYRITPTAAGGLTSEPIATNVDNLIFRYFDRDGNPIPRDGSGAAQLALTPLTSQQRADVRSVEIELVVRTRAEDPNYTGTLEVPAQSVATRGANGSVSTFAAFTDQHRRRVFRSRVTPRNLAVQTCGRLDLRVSDPNPTCPDSVTVTATVLDQYGEGVDGVDVSFDADDGSLSSTSATTAGGGMASTTLSYIELAKPVAVAASAQIDCDTGPTAQTVAVHNSIVVNFTPGDSVRVEVTPDTGTGPLTTCGTDTASFSVEAFDLCGNSVPPQGGLFFDAYLGAAAVHGLNGQTTSVELTPDASTFTVEPPSGAASAYASASRDPSTGWFTLTVNPATAPSWLQDTSAPYEPHAAVEGAPFTVDLRPWPPESLQTSGPSAIAAASHTDCPSDPVSDPFTVQECNGVDIWESLTGKGYYVDHGFTKDTNAPQLDQGAMAISGPDATGTYTATYTPPGACSLGFSPLSLQPTFELGLYEDGGSPVSTAGSETIPLSACLDNCSVTGSVNGGPPANPLTILECDTPAVVDISVTACDLDGKTMELEVTSSGSGSASFDPSATVTRQTVTLSGQGPSQGSTQLYLSGAAHGDTFTVIPYYPDKAGAQWSCTPLEIVVSNECQRLDVYADSSYSQSLGAGASDCLSSLSELYFEVEDCKFTSARVEANPPNDGLWVTVLDRNGVEYDREPVDLDPVILSAPLSPQDLRSVNALPLERDDGGPYLTPDGRLTYPSGQTVTLRAEYRDPTDSTDTCSQDLVLTAPVPVCFPNAITSGGGAGWNGNFKVHWGDVVVRGNIALPSKFIDKSSTGQFNGSGFTGNNYSDRFVDVYAGKQFPGDTATGNFTGEPNPDPSTLDRPFLDVSAGQLYGNYFRNISYEKISDMIVVLDYDTMKYLAQDQHVYWYTTSSGKIHNPAHDYLLAAPYNVPFSQLEWSLQEVLHLSGPGQESYATVTDAQGTPHTLVLHNGDFIFVDTWGASQAGGAPTTSGGEVDQAAQAGTLPVHSIQGSFFTEGIIYLAGTADFGGLGSQTTLTVETPPQYEIHYNHNDESWAVTEDDLPIRSDPNEAQQQFTIAVHINGAFYTDGEITGSGNPSVYGSLTAERGYTGSGTPEIWYNYNLNVSGLNESLCVDCCIMRLVPTGGTLVTGDTVQLTAANASGSVDWSIQSMDPGTAGQTVATLSSGGLLTATAPGSVTVRARDPNNCVATGTFFVTDACDRFAAPDNLTPGSASVAVGGSQTFTVGYTPSGSVSWSLQAQPSGAVTQLSSGSDWVEVLGNCPNALADVTATDPACPGQSLTASLWVDPGTWSCALSLVQEPTTVQNGTAFTFETTGASCGSVEWSASASDGGTYGTLTPDPSDSTEATFQATAETPDGTTVTVQAMDDAGCTDSATFTVGGCPTITLSQSPSGSPLSWGQSYTFTASGGTEDYSWEIDAAASTGSGVLTPSGTPDTETASFEATGSGDVVIRVTDATGCVGETTVTVACPQPLLALPAPADGATYGSLTSNGTALVFQGVPDDNDGGDPFDHIDRLEFQVIEDASGQVIHSQTERYSEYCGFGGNDCSTQPGDVSGWDDGDYTLRVTAYTTSDHACGAVSVTEEVGISVFNASCPISIDPPSPRSLKKRRSVTLFASGQQGQVTWTSLDESLATVSPSTGDSTTVTAANAPHNTVTIRAEDERCFVDYQIQITP